MEPSSPLTPRLSASVGAVGSVEHRLEGLEAAVLELAEAEAAGEARTHLLLLQDQTDKLSGAVQRQGTELGRKVDAERARVAFIQRTAREDVDRLNAALRARDADAAALEARLEALERVMAPCLACARLPAVARAALSAGGLSAQAESSAATALLDAPVAPEPPTTTAPYAALPSGGAAADPL